MSNWSTPHNNTGRVIDGKKLIDLQNYIERSAAVFGLTILGTKVPTALDPVNVDSLRIQIEHLVKTAKNGNREGSIMKFVALGNSIGVGFNVGPTVVAAVAGLAVTNEGLLTADVDWTAYVPDDGGSVVYEVQLWDTDPNPDVLELTGTNLAFGTYNPALHPLTNYKVRVRASWNGGESVTPWSSFVTFTTLTPAAPANLAASNETQVAADIDWDAITVEAFPITYDVEVRRVSDNVLVDSSSAQAGITFAAALNTFTDYKVRVRGNWTDGTVKSTAWSGYVNFSTLNATAPAGLQVTNIQATTVDVDWTAKVIEGYSITYDVSIHLALDDSLITESADQAGITWAATGLTTATNYYVKVRAQWTDAEGTKNTAYSANVPFTTL